VHARETRACCCCGDLFRILADAFPLVHARRTNTHAQNLCSSPPAPPPRALCARKSRYEYQCILCIVVRREFTLRRRTRTHNRPIHTYTTRYIPPIPTIYRYHNTARYMHVHNVRPNGIILDVPVRTRVCNTCCRIGGERGGQGRGRAQSSTDDRELGKKKIQTRLRDG